MNATIVIPVLNQLHYTQQCVKSLLDGGTSPGDLLVIDNLAVQHARGYVELNGPTRTLRKVIAPTPKMKYERPTFDRM